MYLLSTIDVLTIAATQVVEASSRQTSNLFDKHSSQLLTIPKDVTSIDGRMSSSFKLIH